jgi:arylsulfatase A-like enzyme
MSTNPHVLLITTDHWSAPLLGEANHPAILTPTLDELARSGTRFTNAYSECPVCIPARRTLMTGTPPRTHGDRIFKTTEPMPDLPSLAQTFRDAGYQAYGVGKLHVYPQRDRIGFDDVILDEEGRPHLGAVDDYDFFLADQGYAGQGFAHGMSNNEYSFRPWHLPEHCHATTWAAREMSRMIKRRDPTRPGFWYLSFRHPHPPLVPLQSYLDLYMDIDIDPPHMGDWSRDVDNLPYALKAIQGAKTHSKASEIRRIRRAFYALCTQIDHQLRIVIGTLREEGLLDNTIILFTADHGDMLGNHGLWAKRLYYEHSANVPMILLGGGDGRVPHHTVDDRLVGWQDVMPTLLDLAGVEVPDTVEGLSMAGDERRHYLYGECGENATATRMIREGRHKLIYYPVGNRSQLFDLEEDPRELADLSDSPDRAEVLAHLTRHLISELYGGDEAWVQDGQLVGLPDQDYAPRPNRSLSGQRGLHYPTPPQIDPDKSVGMP